MSLFPLQITRNYDEEEQGYDSEKEREDRKDSDDSALSPRSAEGNGTARLRKQAKVNGAEDRREQDMDVSDWVIHPTLSLHFSYKHTFSPTLLNLKCKVFVKKKLLFLKRISLLVCKCILHRCLPVLFFLITSTFCSLPPQMRSVKTGSRFAWLLLSLLADFCHFM